MKTNLKITIVIIIIIIIGAFIYFQKSNTNSTPPNIVVDIKQNVENYLRENISRLSPVKAVLGGTWYVVSITTDLVKNSGTVTYEDGHIQEKRNFSFITDEKGEVISLTITSVILKSGITGTVTLGPTCPIERIPPDPNCAPKPYSTSINIMKSGDTAIIKTIQSDSTGIFHVDLAPNTYILQTKGGNILPKCGDISVEVIGNLYTTANISCDTGLR